MRIFALVIIAAALVGLPAAAACAVSEPPTPAGGVMTASPSSSSSSPSSSPGDAAPVSRQATLVNLTDAVIVPRFEDTAAMMNGLREALDALCANPTPDALAAARTAWREARAPWMRSQAFRFGPVMERRSRSLLDWSPVEPERIETMLAERDAIAASDIREFLAATQRGLGAIEYVIFDAGADSANADGDANANANASADSDSDSDSDSNDAAILAALRPAAGIRCQYLTALGEVSAAETAGILADWTGANADGKAYAGYFNGTAASSLLGKAAVDEIVRHSVFLTRSITDMRLGAALAGNGNGGAPDLEALLAGPGDNTVADIRNQVLGMQDLYLGGNSGPGIGALVRGISPEADARMTAHFAAALDALDGLSEPLPESIATDPTPARYAHQQLQNLQRALNTEVVSLLGVSVGFADTDGDGG